MNVLNIIRGWLLGLNWTKRTPEINRLSKERLSVCKVCMHSKSTKVLRVLNGKENYEDSLMCTKCSCPCLEKSLVKQEKCPLKKWLK